MRRIFLTLVLFTAVLLNAPTVTAVSPSPATVRQEATPTSQLELISEDERVERLLADMTPEQRVGQLFLVTFVGDQVTSESDITDLILNYHVGGVTLDRDNDNLTGYGDLANVPLQVATLTTDLQSLALTGKLASITDTLETEIEEALPPTLIPGNLAQPSLPLFIAINHEGDGYPFTGIMNGLTGVPSNMAIGATWQPKNARLVGQVVGQELTAVGVNMLLGPALDVLENSNPDSPGDMGVRSFGGDPYWVGLMGQAYTGGVHEGSNGRVAVIAKHFPGFGASDRPLHEDIPTVQKQLNQLMQVELVPFFAVTGETINDDKKADGLLSAHIRYQGFQGNVQASTKPISLDPQALSTLLSLSQFSNWRNNGGLIVSDALGVRAIERFYDSTEQQFPHRVVTKDAFLAGNDLLYLADFALGDNAPYEEQLANMKDTILWFQERYQSDVAFQMQVDAAVQRILKLKLRLYGDDLTVEQVVGETVLEGRTAVLGQNEPAIFDVAQQSLTLISPSPDVLAERITRPPGPGENIIIFTDVRLAQQCTECPPQPLISQTAIQERILSLYGPQASAQVESSQISSYNFDDLSAFLAAGSEPIIYNGIPITPTLIPDVATTPEFEATVQFPTATPPSDYLVQESLRDVDWIIFALLDNKTSNQALSEFLALRPDLLRDHQVIAFAYNAPYYLDTTEITQLTAYYGVYSKVNSFIDASVRALFQELPLQGALPVNVQAIRYDLLDTTQPDPAQVIPLRYVTEGESVESSDNGDPPLAVSVGDTLRLQTGVIVDKNGNPVPDNTVVRFIERDRVQGSLNIFAEVSTLNGMAQLDYVLQARTEGGQFRIGVQAGEALISQELDISVSDSEQGEAQVVIINPTPAPTSTPIPTATPTLTPTSIPSETPSPTAIPQPAPELPMEPSVRIELSEFWMLTAVTTALFTIMGIALLVGNQRDMGLEYRLGWPLWGVMGGLFFYIYYALGLPGTAVLQNLGIWAGLLTTLTGGLLGLLIYRLRMTASGNGHFGK
ncbi:MAG: glycoside hydrolase family 3 protein [Chloroflexi bacterium]|nr:glycoside hydrolase family 3 protein [Chloroflexota bacterium]